jgi:hypothetical protein
MKTIIYFLMFILISCFVIGSYAVSSPTKVIVEQGGSGGFDFQIQAYTSEDDLECSYDISENPFEVVFDGSEVVKKTSKVVYGTVFAPKDVDVGDYSYEFCVSCVPSLHSGGASANIRFCGIDLNIEVIDSPKEMMSPIKIIFVSVLLVLLLFVLFFLFKRK